MAFRVDQQGNLVAFAGHGCRQITVDGRTTVFAETPLPLVMFAPLAAARRVPGGAVGEVSIGGLGAVRIPFHGLPEKARLYAEGPLPGSKGAEASFQRDGTALVLRTTPAESARRIWIAPEE